MPALPIPIIAALIGAGTAATTTGLELSGALSPGMPKQAPQNPQAVTPQLQQGQRAAVSAQLPTLQSQVGGSVSPEYYLQEAQLSGGTANQPGSAASAWDSVSQYFGLGSPGLTTSTGTSSGGLTSGATGTQGTNNIVAQGLDELMKSFPGLTG